MGICVGGDVRSKRGLRWRKGEAKKSRDIKRKLEIEKKVMWEEENLTFFEKYNIFIVYQYEFDGQLFLHSLNNL